VPYYRFAGQDFRFPYSIVDGSSFILNRAESKPALLSFHWENETSRMISNTVGWVGDSVRRVEIQSTASAFLLKVEGASDFYISFDGQIIIKLGQTKENLSRDVNEITSRLSLIINSQVLLGPALVLALAMRGTWSLHASAAMFQGETIALLGESGQGKSTLAAYLSSDGGPGWQRIADDILPATLEQSEITVWPHFPQLKMPADKQPGLSFPEHLPLDKICILTSADIDAIPALEQVSPAQAAQVLLAHTAGTRMFPPDLLVKHLDFCAEVAKRVPVYRLTYPHRREILPVVKSLLQNIR
jgi:hypothetical protein